MALAVLALLGVLAGIVFAFVQYGVNTKTVVAAFISLLALGGLIGRMVFVARDSFDKK